MTIYRNGIEFSKRICLDRRGNEYVYGGTWSPAVLTQGCDCSGLVTDVCSAVCHGTAMIWGRENISTETWRLYPGQMQALFSAIRAPNPQAIPADAAVKIALHHGGGGVNSHMWCIVDGVGMESNGTDGCVMGADARDMVDGGYANDWYYIPGPIVEDGTPRQDMSTLTEPKDTLFADVSEFQAQVNDAYTAAGYRWLSIRSNDGTYQDHHFAANYAWAKAKLDAGQLDGLIVYYFWRAGETGVHTHMAMVNAQGGPHPKMVSMIDLESGNGNPQVDESPAVNDEYGQLQRWLGNPLRVIGYANLGDERTMWQFKPAHVPMILAGYGSNPSDPSVFKIAHQYTDGKVGAGGLPSGAPPFGNCDMNSADGFSPTALAAALGIGGPPPPPPGGISMSDAQDLINQTAGTNRDGTPELWRKVHARHDRAFGAITGDPTRGPWNSTHNGVAYDGTFDADEQMVTVAEQIAWTHKFSDGITRDHGDVLLELMEYVIAQRTAQKQPTSFFTTAVKAVKDLVTKPTRTVVEDGISRLHVVV